MNSPHPNHYRLLGFDLRSLEFQDKNLWDRQRCEMYLLNESCERIFSVDPFVWSGPFHDDMCARALGKPGRQYAQYDGLASADIGTVPQWENLDKLHAFIDANKQRLKGAWMAVGIAEQHEMMDKNLLPETWRIDPGWKLLGYDVVSGGTISGLTNCGYSEKDKSALQDQFAGKLSEHHLFDTEADAEEFAAVSDNRVAEHAPFIVHALYEIETLLIE